MGTLFGETPMPNQLLHINHTVRLSHWREMRAHAGTDMDESRGCGGKVGDGGRNTIREH